MIYDKIENIKNYSQIPEIVKGFMLEIRETRPVGRIYLNSDKTLWANVDEYTTKPHKDCKFEAHKKYIDIQFMLSGKEIIETAFTDELEITETYDETKDVMFLKDTKNKTVLNMAEGYFALFYPTDAHKPQVAYLTPEKVKKVVVKIPL